MCMFYFGLMTEQQDYAPKASLLWAMALALRLPSSVALAVMLVLTSASLANDVRGELATAARAFDESALRLGDDNARAIGVRKWNAAIALRFANANRAPGLVGPTRKAIQGIAGQTPGIPRAQSLVDEPHF